MDASGPRPRILLVDDNATSREMFGDLGASLLQQCELIQQPNGKEALKLLEESTFDLVITDEVMPAMSGSSLFNQCRDTGIKTPFIIIIGLTARDVMAKVNRKYKDTLTVLEKPLKRERYLNALGKYLQVPHTNKPA